MCVLVWNLQNFISCTLVGFTRPQCCSLIGQDPSHFFDAAWQ